MMFPLRLWKMTIKFLGKGNPTTECIWCFLDFDRRLHSILTRWRRFDYGIRSGFMTSLLIQGGDSELNPGPNQQLQIALFNARSPVNVYSRNFDKIAVIEIHLDDTVSSSERQIFKEPPLISYKRGKSLKDIVVRAKL